MSCMSLGREEHVVPSLCKVHHKTEDSCACLCLTEIKVILLFKAQMQRAFRVLIFFWHKFFCSKEEGNSSLH